MLKTKHYLYEKCKQASTANDFNKQAIYSNILYCNILYRDIPKIIKFKATNSLRVSCLFCIFKHSPQKTV
ncbi:hypothetical protein FQN58_19635 [Bacteroides xylanisolvens]|uniref:Uncharacterized protein n=1 Tax=Bacteroides xylanisolvens TaxID=371601 RepID=A0A7J5P2M0_9BACE|nr:hypothetical protein GA574_11580 [Bacteroides xylanisolvens]QUR45262.1 hypothetical protein FQN58_19635 [Bacteroides xylanisolvens]